MPASTSSREGERERERERREREREIGRERVSALFPNTDHEAVSVI